MTISGLSKIGLPIVIAAMLALLYMPAAALADRALRCQGRLVHIGDSKTEVLSKCGQPDHVDQWEENPRGDTFRIYDYEQERYHLPERIKGPIWVERWTYDLGSNRFTRYLLFHNGKLKTIERGEK